MPPLSPSDYAPVADQLHFTGNLPLLASSVCLIGYQSKSAGAYRTDPARLELNRDSGGHA